MTKNALLKRGPKNSGMGRPPPPPHLGNARKKTFFCIDVFPYSLQCDFDCFVAPTFIQITIFSLRLRFQRAQCGETLIVGSSYTPLAETKTTFKYVLFYVPGYSKKSTTCFFQNHGRVIQAVPKSLIIHLIVRAT